MEEGLDHTFHGLFGGDEEDYEREEEGHQHVGVEGDVFGQRVIGDLDDARGLGEVVVPF